MPRIFFAFLYLLAAGLAATALPFHPPFSAPVAYAAGGLVVVLSLLHVPWAIVAIGFFLILLPFFGKAILSFVFAAWLSAIALKQCISPGGERRYPGIAEECFISGIGIVLLLVSVSIFHALLLETDFFVLRSVYQHGGFSGLLHLASSDYMRWNKLPVEWTGYLIAGLLGLTMLRLRNERPEVVSLFLHGAAWGTIISALVTLMQVVEIPYSAINRAEFWKIEGRFPATFTDPNAFGIIAALLVPIFLVLGYRQRRTTWWVAGVFLLCVVPWSGSRSFWMGMVLWLILLVSQRLKSKNSRTRLVTLTGVALGGLLLLGLLSQPAINQGLQTMVRSPAAKRLLASVNWETANDMSLSRVVYARLALHVWKEHWLFGAGWGKFFDEQGAAATALGIELHGWRDNPNNFYLQILAESGVFGLVLLLGALGCFFKAVQSAAPNSNLVEASSMFRLALMVMLILFLFGPHLQFDEVRYLVMVILAGAVPIGGGAGKSRGRTLSIACMVSLLAGSSIWFMQPRPAEAGLYGLEHSDDGFFAWTTEYSEFELCSDETDLPLAVRTFQPQLGSSPVEVRVSSQAGGGGQVQLLTVLKLSDTNWQETVLQLPPNTSVHGSRIILNVNRVWSPSGGSSSGDARYLGVMIRWPKQACLQPN